MSPAIKENFVALDGLRGLAALFVCVFHTPQYWGFALPHAPLAVDLFFLLSGFVIGHSYDSKLADGRLSAPTFMVVRLIRLYPMYLLSLLISTALTLTGVLVHQLRGERIVLEYTAAALAAVFFLPLRISDTMTLCPMNTAYWSLFFELLNNFVYAALRPQITNRALVAIVTVAAIALAAIAHDNGAGGVILGSFWGWESILGGLARSVFGIFAGLLLHRMQPKLSGKWLASGGYGLAMLVIAIVLGSPAIGAADWLLQLLVVFVVFPLCIAGVVAKPQTTGPAVLRILGVASYPIYVLHLPLAHALEIFTFRRFGHFPPVSGMVMVVLLFVLALVSVRKFDVPVRRFLSARIFAGIKSSAPLLKSP